jgi:hypothetical protein
LNIIEVGLDEFAVVMMPPMPFASTDVDIKRNGTALLPACPYDSVIMRGNINAKMKLRDKMIIVDSGMCAYNRNIESGVTFAIVTAILSSMRRAIL